MKIGLGIGLGYSKESGGAIPPAIASVTISGTAVVGQTLTATASGVTGIPAPTLSYQWKRGVTNIGTNSSTYTLVQADADNASNITCVVTGTNSAGSANATSNTIAQILTARTSAFLTASAISDATIRGGLNTFDIGLIANSLDTKMKALYPFVADGADNNARALQQRWNFMDARDLDAAFRLAFSGTITHSANGIQGNGTNGFANTFLNDSTVLSVANKHISLYSRTNSAATIRDMGVIDGSSNAAIAARWTDSNTYFQIGNAFAAANLTNSLGFFVSNKITSGQLTGYKNGVLAVSNASTNVATNLNHFLLCFNNMNNPQGYSNRQYCLFSLGDGLTPTDNTNFYNLVQSLQTTLGRQV
jgi:hypothetical protein